MVFTCGQADGEYVIEHLSQKLAQRLAPFPVHLETGQQEQIQRRSVHTDCKGSMTLRASYERGSAKQHARRDTK